LTLLLAAMGGVVALPSTGQAANRHTDGAVDVVFDHAECADRTGNVECRASYVVDASDGDVITITIKNTYPDDFVFTVAGIPVASPPDELRPQSNQTRDTTLTQRHDERFGGYIVTLTRKQKVSQQGRPEVTLVIAVRTSEWKAMFGGGFSVSSLVGRAFGLRDSTITAATESAEAVTQTQLVRDKHREDQAGYGAATFIHLYHTKRPSLGISFGLGLTLNESSSAAYYFGPSFRFGNKGALTVGGMVGPVKTLPPGLREDDVVTDNTTVSNALNALPSRTGRGFFVSLSYAFLGGGVDALNKPFAGAAEPTATPKSTEKGSSSGETTPETPTLELETSSRTAKVGDEIEFKVTVAGIPDDTPPGLPVTLIFDPSTGASGPQSLKIENLQNGVGTVTTKVRIQARNALQPTLKVSAKVSGIDPPIESTPIDILIEQ
jgi:hypothetical protein